MSLAKQARRYRGAVLNLSRLSRTQLGILLLTHLAAAAAIAVEPKAPSVLRVLTPVCFLLAVQGALFTIANENAHAWVALAVLLVQHASFLAIGMAVAGDGTPSGVRWGAVASDAVGLFLYAALQVGVRGDWGWHAYKTQLTSQELIESYQAIQRVHAVLLFAFWNTAMAVVFVAFFVVDGLAHAELHLLLACVACLYAAASAPALAHCLNRDDRVGAYVAGALTIVSSGCSAAAGVTSMALHGAGTSRPPLTTFQYVGAAQVCFSSLAQLLVSVTLFRVRHVFGTELMVAIARSREAQTLISDDVLEKQHRRGHQQRRGAEHGRVDVPLQKAGAVRLHPPEAAEADFTSDDDR